MSTEQQQASLSSKMDAFELLKVRKKSSSWIRKGNSMSKVLKDPIDIRHHFISDPIEENVITLSYVNTNAQLVDLLTNALDTQTKI